MARKEYEVVVGNGGTVYRGTSKPQAIADFREYARRSAKSSGRVAGEDVYLMCDGEIVMEHNGYRETGDYDYDDREDNPPKAAKRGSLMAKVRSNEYYTKNAHRIVGHLEDLSPAVYGTLTRSAKGKYRAGPLGKAEEVEIVAVLLSAYPELLGYICDSLDMSRGERAANGKGRPQAKTTTEKVPRGFVLLDNGGQSHDRYTILETVSRPLSSRGGGNFHPYLRFSVNPYSSYGKMSYGELNKTAFQNVKSGGYAYFGKRINLSDLAGSGAHMTALAYIQDSAAESKSDRAANPSGRTANPSKSDLLDSVGKMTRSYLNTAIWAESDPNTGEPLSDKYDKESFNMASIKQAKADCDAFMQAVHAAGLADTKVTKKGVTRTVATSPAAVGHDFWLTRCHHGAGFWDGDYEAGEELTNIAHRFAERGIFPSGKTLNIEHG